MSGVRGRRRAAGPTALALVALACGDLPHEGQVLVYVDSDAPFPPAPGTIDDEDEAPPLFDRLRVEVFAPGDSVPCDGCSRDFAVTRDALLGLDASVGVLPTPGTSGYRVRVRGYLETMVELTEPLARTTMDTTIALPPIAAEGVVEGTVLLSTAGVGTPRGSLDAPAAWQDGAPDASRVGQWSEARRVPCSGDADPGEVCVPGGAFWMGDPVIAGGSMHDDAPRPRLVVMSPFFLDATEVTVGAIRAWLRDGAGAGGTVDDPAPWSGNEPALFAPDWCTFPADLGDASRDHLPVNCISAARARQFCRERVSVHPGSDLPTEAQLEYAAAATRGWRYPWGWDEPRCGDAVHASGGQGIYADRYPGDCRLLEGAGGPAPAGSGARDAVELEGGTILDLAGNLGELARDAWSPQAGSCWTPSLMRDPECETESSGSTAGVTIRGGSWASAPYELHRAFRRTDDDTARPSIPTDTRLGPLVGFRCARPADD